MTLTRRGFFFNKIKKKTIVLQSYFRPKILKSPVKFRSSGISIWNLVEESTKENTGWPVDHKKTICVGNII